MNQNSSDNLPYEKIGKNDPVCIADEVPFDIPDSWEWVRHNEIFEISGGSQPSKSKFISTPKDGYIRLFQIRDYGVNPIPIYIPIETAKKISQEGDILLARYGASLGKVFWAQNGAYNVAMAKVIPLYKNNWIYKEYLFLYYQSDLYQSIIHGNSRSAQAGFNKEDLYNLFIPIPPFAEQKRIVEKYKELSPLIDQYNELEEKITKLNDNFPELLKKSILQEAVQGKLVPQDQNDEPASVLLERIREEKQRLIAEGKIKKDKHESVIFKRDNSHYEKQGSNIVCIDDELPFEIPKNWQWVKLSDLVQFIGGYAYKSETFIEKSEYQVLRLGNVKNDKIRYSTKPVFISKRLAEKTADFRCQTNDILITMTGTRLKRDYFYTVIVSENDTNCFINQRVGCLRCYLPNLCKWLIWVLKSEEVLSQVFQYETGTANQGNLGAENIMKTFIPLPPLDEQDRICKLIEHLLKQVNTM